MEGEARWRSRQGGRKNLQFVIVCRLCNPDDDYDDDDGSRVCFLFFFVGGPSPDEMGGEKTFHLTDRLDFNPSRATLLAGHKKKSLNENSQGFIFSNAP